ncbi:MAG: [protein-PII] uridylyltransferase, partial [Puniceicoccaceae bacterium]
MNQFRDDPLFKRLYKHADKRLVFDPEIPRSKQLPAYKRFLELENKMLARYHRNGESGLRVCRARAIVLDVLVENLFLGALDTYAAKFGQIPAKMSVVATGGYGRAELNPHSDVDIMFLYPRSVKVASFKEYQALVAEEILYPLWDLGLKVGHASRNIHEAIAEARSEIQSKNAILESRLVTGSQSLYKEFYEAYDRYIRKERPTEYIKQRLADQAERHAKYGGTVYLQEPDIKNGCGGLRDYQNIVWMANIKLALKSFRDLQKAGFLRPDEDKAMVEAYDFLLRVRTELHLGSRRPTDHLDLETQPKVALGLGYKQKDIFERVEAFMRDYYTAVRTIFRTSQQLEKRLALTEDESGGKITFKEALRAHRSRSGKRIDGFLFNDKVLSADTKNPFKEDPDRMIRVFRIMQQFNAELDFDLEYLISRSLPLITNKVIRSASAIRSFLAIISSPGEVYPILIQMYELGVLSRFLPEFGKLTCMVQHEYYHRYTADVHVLNTIRELDNVFQKRAEIHPDYEKELRKTDDPVLLYLILLLHDIGKAEGIKGHAVSGVRIAKPILKRFGISKAKQDKIYFIIRSHLEMARFWQRYDLDDEETAASFAKFTEDPEKLRYLYVHTICDARGTAPTLWNGYKDSSHRLLFKRTLEHHLHSDDIAVKREGERKMLLSDLLDRSIDGISAEEVEAHFNLLPERYFINNSADEIALHLRMVHELLQKIQDSQSIGSLVPIIDWRDDHDEGLSIVTVVTWDRAGLFYKLAGALSVAGVNILNTKAISRSDHITIDTFYVIEDDGGVVQNKKARAIFQTRLEEALV